MNKNKKKSFFLGEMNTNDNKSAELFRVQEGSFRFGQLRDSSYHRGWTEDSFLSGNQEKEAVGRTFNNTNLLFFKTLIIIFMLFLIGRIAWLQIVMGSHYSLLSERNRIRTENLESKRGIIYDRSGEALVRNSSNFVLSFRPIDLPRDEMDRDMMLRRLSSIIDNLPEKQIITNSDSLKLVSDGPSYRLMKEMLSKVRIYSLEAYQSLFILDNLRYDAALKIILEQESFPGVLLEDKILREYPFSFLAQEDANLMSLSHVLGYTGKISEADLENFSGKYSLTDYVGKTGIEYSWEEELRGINGFIKYEVDALGRKKKVISETLPQAGYNLSLSLDIKLQAQAEKVTKAWLEKTNTKRASVIIMDPNNGQILALLSLPSYDNNLFAKGIKQVDYDEFIQDENRPLFNRAISGELPSGSVIKPVIAAAALEEHIITENTSFLSNGGLRIGQWFFPDWRAGGHGTTNVKKALADSVNTFFYYIGGGYQDFVGLGVDRLAKYMKLFGMGEKTGIDLNGESKGLVPTPAWKERVKNEAWYIGDTYHISIGQGDVLVSPLQVANFTAAIVNGGRLYQPTLVRALLDEDNNVLKEIEPKIIRQDFISPENLRIVREGMHQAVLSGSARSLSILPVSSGGKTGTAQWSSTKANHAWFTAFAPYENPLISITVMVEEGREGSEVAVPIAREIMQWYFSSEQLD